MFKLSEQDTKLAHINVREEMHGDEEVLAADLKIATTMANQFLEQLSPGLRESLYAVADDPALDLEPDAPHMSKLRHPRIMPIKWRGEAKNADVTVHFPGNAKDIKFLADVNMLRFTPLEGGSVEIVFRIQVYPEPKLLGQLAAYLGKELKISVEPDDDAMGETSEE